jgi:O-antigen biosynthesis protein
VNWSYAHDPRPDIQALIRPGGCRILDVGCAAGELGAALKAHGTAFVAGIEASSDSAAQARAALDLVVEGDLQTVDLPFALESFDYLVFADVLEHVADPEAALRRFLPFLASNGRVIVSVPNMRFYLVVLRLLLDRWSYTDSGIRDRTHLRIFTRRSLSAMLNGLGLRVERIERNFRLFEDQSRIGRWGVAATRVAGKTLALLFRDLLAFQYVVLARRVGDR